MEKDRSLLTTQLTQPALFLDLLQPRKIFHSTLFVAKVEQKLSTVTQFTKPQEHVFTL